MIYFIFSVKDSKLFICDILTYFYFVLITGVLSTFYTLLRILTFCKHFYNCEVCHVKSHLLIESCKLKYGLYLELKLKKAIVAKGF